PPTSNLFPYTTLFRSEDENTGTIGLPELYVQVPPQRIEQAKEAARILGTAVYDKFPFAGSIRPMSTDIGELTLNRTWRPQLAVRSEEHTSELQSRSDL